MPTDRKTWEKVARLDDDAEFEKLLDKARELREARGMHITPVASHGRRKAKVVVKASSGEGDIIEAHSEPHSAEVRPRNVEPKPTLGELSSEIPHGTTQMQINMIIAAVRGGADIKSAARCARMRPAVVENWMAKGQVEDAGWFHGFYMDFEHARGLLGTLISSRILNAGKAPGQWKANVYMGRQRIPEAFAEEGGSKGSGTTVNVLQAHLSPETEKVLAQVSLDDLRSIASETEKREGE